MAQMGEATTVKRLEFQAKLKSVLKLGFNLI